MASFHTRARKTAKKAATRAKRRVASSTFIQRSRQESSEQKAMFHQVTGAGRSHVKRQFFGWTPDEQAAAKAALEGVLAKRLTELNAS